MLAGRMHTQTRNILLSTVIVLTVSCSDSPPELVETSRPKKWAEPIKVDGVPNLHKVSPDLYRSAQPTAAGMKALKKMGIRTVVNLRSFHSDRDEIDDTGLQYEHIYMKAWHPEEKEIVRFLQIVGDKARVPVLVHCQHGADRTGTMCAIYRIAVSGWSKEEAVKEMTGGGFGFHEVWENLIEYINGLDIEAIKKKAAGGQNVCHIVLCWLKEPGDSEGRDKIIETSKHFSEIPGVLSVRTGQVLPSEREIVDSSFDVAIVLWFRNKEEMSEYLVHPAHKKAVKDVLQPLVKKIVVYDFVEE